MKFRWPAQFERSCSSAWSRWRRSPCCSSEWCWCASSATRPACGPSSGFQHQASSLAMQAGQLSRPAIPTRSPASCNDAGNAPSVDTAKITDPAGKVFLAMSGPGLINLSSRRNRRRLGHIPPSEPLFFNLGGQLGRREGHLRPGQALRIRLGDHR
jgi:hypothetical protein